MKKFSSWLIFLIAVSGPLFGFLGRWFWFFDLFAHFRVQFTALLLAALLLLVLGRAFKKAALLTCLFAFCFWSISPYLFPRKVASSIEGDVTFLYANVYTANQNHERLLHLIREKNPDIVVLLEINHRWQEFLEKNLTDFETQKFVTREDNFGIAIFSKIPMRIQVEYLGEAQVPSFKCELTVKGKEIILWTTHPLPPVGQTYWSLRNEHLQNLARFISAETKPTLLIGDLNTSPWSHWFKFGTTGRLSDSRKGFGIQLSWPTMWPWFIRVPIDHLLYSREFEVLERSILPEVGSDHFPFYAKLRLAT